MSTINTYLASLKPRVRQEALRELTRWGAGRGGVAHWRTSEAWAEVDVDELADYLDGMEPAARSKARWVFRAMLALVGRDDLDVEGSRRRPGTTLLTIEQQRQLLTQLDGPTPSATIRDGVILALLLETGMLARELAELRWSDISGNTLTLRRQEGVATFRLSSGVTALLSAWGKLAGEVGTIVRPVDRYGKVASTKITDRAINQAVERAGDRLGLQLGAFDLRRAWLARARAGGVPIELIELVEGR